MAVFRVEKTKDFTVMSNHHLRNTELSLKAKGLLSLMAGNQHHQPVYVGTVYCDLCHCLWPHD